MTKKKALAAYIDSALADMRGELEDIYDDLGIDAKDPLLGYEEVGGGETAKFSLPRVYTQTGDTADSFVLADGDPNFGEITTDIRRIAQLRRRLDEIRPEVDAFRHQEIFQLKQTIEETEALGGDPLGDLAQKLLQEISERRIQIEVLQAL